MESIRIVNKIVINNKKSFREIENLKGKETNQLLLKVNDRVFLNLNQYFDVGVGWREELSSVEILFLFKAALNLADNGL